MALTSGTKLGSYEIQSLLGAGGMGEVYRARDTRLDREVAIKVLPAAFSADSDRLHRFEKEARSASALNHPNIITIHELGQDGSTHYIAMLRAGCVRSAGRVTSHNPKNKNQRESRLTRQGNAV